MKIKILGIPILITLLGVGCNRLVSWLNAGMPAHTNYATANKYTYDLLNLPYPKHTSYGPYTKLPFLADILPFGLSIGDVLIFVGLIWGVIILIKTITRDRLVRN